MAFDDDEEEEEERAMEESTDCLSSGYSRISAFEKVIVEACKSSIIPSHPGLPVTK
jgi:hypothetical protein